MVSERPKPRLGLFFFGTDFLATVVDLVFTIVLPIVFFVVEVDLGMVFFLVVLLSGEIDCALGAAVFFLVVFLAVFGIVCLGDDVVLVLAMAFLVVPVLV